jgi:hypothetical protein|tara:strand:+ start:18322 stop:18774 length:453 start_codon:yes stop_codon:yes gene_type:complete
MHSPKYKLRFNLQHGKHYKHWQITNVKTKVKEHYNPKDYMIIANDCKLVNIEPKARMIYEGKTCKDVCAWVECKHFEAIPVSELKDNIIKLDNLLIDVYMYTTKICYNPRVDPFWTVTTSDNIKYNTDNMNICNIITKSNSVYCQALKLD